MAIQAVGGVFASAFLDVLLEKFSSSVIDHWISFLTKEDALHYSGLDRDLRRLRTALLKNQAVLSRAENRQINEDSLRALLRELQDAAYDADDLLDDFEYQLLKQKVEGGRQRKRKSLPSINFFCNDDTTSNKIREVIERLDRVSADAGEILRLVDPIDEEKQLEITKRRETSSFLIEPVVFGRDEEREDVVKLLLRSGYGFESSIQNNVSVLPIVGIGGVGKTTLAQFVYNDQRVKDFFQLRVWVYVSTSFDVKRLVREIVESLTEERPSDITNLNKLHVILEEKLMGKRFLLVLDDMWNEERNKWESLYTPLRTGAQGSMILITTRSQKVAATVGTMNPVSLGGLADDAYWSFFKKCSFGDGYSKKHPVLEAIGRKIANKLKGSPLAAKTIGSQLNSDFNEKHWRSIMKSDIWSLQQNEGDILPVLRLSFQHLPAHLKQCFAYCSIFPKGYNFDKASLVQMWMAQGFIKPQRNMRMEDIGREYFDDLLCKSFFQHLFGAYVMHDLIHDLAKSISVDDCFSIEDDRSREIPRTVRHLSLSIPMLESSEVDLCKFKKLRTLAFFQGYNSYKFQLDHVLNKLFKELRSIRVLSLVSCQIVKLPDTISNLKHLRYLDLSFSTIEELTKSLCSLYNLQVLNLQQCLWCTLPEGLSNLINLQHLVMDHDKFSMIAGIGKLTSLQELTDFSLYDQSGHKIGELRDLKELRGRLCISNLENIESTKEANEAR